jgi:hypothetical protein
MIEKLLAQVYDLVLDDLADRIATRIQRRDDGLVDQTTSPLGPRRHINAIKTGELPGKKLGRRYIASVRDVESFARRSESSPRIDHEAIDETDELARELGFHKAREKESK